MHKKVMVFLQIPKQRKTYFATTHRFRLQQSKGGVFLNMPPKTRKGE